jgi:hypothetical protein
VTDLVQRRERGVEDRVRGRDESDRAVVLTLTLTLTLLLTLRPCTTKRERIAGVTAKSWRLT